MHFVMALNVPFLKPAIRLHATTTLAATRNIPVFLRSTSLKKSSTFYFPHEYFFPSSTCFKICSTFFFSLMKSMFFISGMSGTVIVWHVLKNKGPEKIQHIYNRIYTSGELNGIICSTDISKPLVDLCFPCCLQNLHHPLFKEMWPHFATKMHCERVSLFSLCCWVVSLCDLETRLFNLGQILKNRNLRQILLSHGASGFLRQLGTNTQDIPYVRPLW